MEESFYVQDTRNYVGNSILWWRHEGQGYTTDLAEAMIVDKNWVGRPTDKLWEINSIDAIATKQVDMQKLRSLK